MCPLSCRFVQKDGQTAGVPANDGTGAPVSEICVPLPPEKTGYMLIVLSASLLPVAVLLLYIYRRDTFQKEPFRLLAKAFFFGILAAVLDTAVASLFNNLVPQPPVSPLNDALYTSLVLAALPEELCKLVMLYLCIWKSPFFDEYFDGVEYCAFLGLGFAAIENVLYVLQGGLGLAVSRGLFAVPAHFFFAIFMGYFFSMARFRYDKRKKYLLLAYFIPVILHAIYDLILMYANNLSSGDYYVESTAVDGFLSLVFIVFFFFVWRSAIARINKISGR